MMGGRRPAASTCQDGGVESHPKEASVTEVNTIGLDLAKNVYQAHGADGAGAPVFRRKLRRDQVLAFFAAQPSCIVAMEACPGAHQWGREIGKLGHTVKLIAPAYVEPFFKRQKSDAADAEAICEAAQRPTMRFVAVKSEAKQAFAMIFRTRDVLVGQRSQLINAIRGHLAEYGQIAPQGPAHVEQLVAQIEDPASHLPPAARASLAVLVGTLRHLQEQTAALDADIAARGGRRHGPTADERTGYWPADCHRHRGPGPARRDVPLGPRLCSLGRADTGAALDRRQGTPRSHLAPGRANAEAPADHRSQRGGALGQAQGRAVRLVAGPDAGAHAADAGHRGCGQQERTHCLGPSDEG